ncbi:hypothetical protein [Methylobacterium platani]|uniref:Uncharacterized protein n=2 Tax=Methylobacterium platani TaxID=427683 RepID=A0A179S8H6_9HYPH|nr:hypothetical protein [Methylobacterium platani]KMO10599.1 hypothetical protein SQ03_29730 [Methylobacterium platani JCM 14648]OAS23946.1 hypothetical protein A5481_15990 [Methylobacterium platani]
MAWNWPRGREHRGGIPAASAASEASPVTRTLDLATTFSAAGAEAVSATRCADPATCGSEFQADSFSSRRVTCTRCGLQGALDLQDAAGEAASHG